MNRKNIFPYAFFVGLVFVSSLTAQVTSKRNELAVYEQYGLTFNQTESAYFYNNKIVGVFVDQQERILMFSNTGGEINIKVVRDNDGRINGLEELSATEYNAIIVPLVAREAELDAREVELEKRMEDLRERVGNLRSPARYHQNRR